MARVYPTGPEAELRRPERSLHARGVGRHESRNVAREMQRKPRGLLFVRLSFAVVGILLSAAIAAADPVTITSGSVTVRSPLVIGFVAVEGTEGFSLFADTTGWVDLPHGWCFPCLPGETISFSAAFEGLHGTATYQGREFTLGLLGGGGVIRLAAPSFELPEPATLGPVVFEFPFTATGFAAPLDPAFEAISFLGAGTVRGFLTSSPLNFPGRPIQYSLSRIEYEFEDVPPIPEPGTLLLIGSGLTALVFRRRAR